MLLSKINKLNLNDNICFHDYFPIHADMHQHIVQANFAVLPVKLDSISGAVIEAILLGLPVVTNKTSKMPFLNKDGESVLLSEIDNVEMLAENMIKLVKSPELAKALRENARKFILNEYDEKRMVENLLRTYESIINHYHHGINIPNELLFDINEFPIYQ